MDEERGGPEMKILMYGNLKIQLDLTADEEKIFMEAIQSDIAAARKYHNFGRKT